MSLVDVLPEAQALSRRDKFRLIEVLTKDLERDDGDVIEPGQSYPVWSPDKAYSAAEIMMQALAEDKGKP